MLQFVDSFIGQCRLNNIRFLGRLYSGLSGPFLFLKWPDMVWFLDHSMRCAGALAALAAACCAAV
jgi:hypothetical protein